MKGRDIRVLDVGDRLSFYKEEIALQKKTIPLSIVD